MNGIHIQYVFIAGALLGVLYDVEYNVEKNQDENCLIIAFFVIGIKINWW